MTPDLGFIHRFIPSTSPGTETTLLLLHGTGGDEQDLIPLGQALLPGAAILSPRGKVLEHGMPRFFRRFAEGVFDVEDLKFRAGELAQFVTDARRTYSIVGDVVAAGYSNGANIAAGLMLLHPGLLAGAILLRAMVPFVPEIVPDLAGTKVLLCAGRQDRIIPPEGAVQLSEILERCGADVSFQWHSGGHELGPDDVDVAREWLQARKPSNIEPRH